MQNSAIRANPENASFAGDRFFKPLSGKGLEKFFEQCYDMISAGFY